MNTILYYIKLLRPLNVITSGIAVLIATAILEELENVNILLLTATIVMLYTAASNSLNDALDHEIDLINRPDRPIPSNNVSIQGAMFLSLIFSHLDQFFVCNYQIWLKQLAYLLQFLL